MKSLSPWNRLLFFDKKHLFWSKGFVKPEPAHEAVIRDEQLNDLIQHFRQYLILEILYGFVVWFITVRD